MDETRLVLFDGNSLVHRAFHALPSFTVSKTGETVGAVYGFALMLLKVISELKPTHCAIAFDLKAPTFRHQLYDQYKAHRPAMPDELAGQLARVRELVAAFRIPVFELAGYEADDLLGTLSCQAATQGIDTVIVTGDADAMQLVSDRVRVFAPKRGFGDTMLYDAAAVAAKYCVPPEHIADLKGLQGDSSDNIPGVPGVGAKTAVKLVTEFGAVEDIYERLDAVTPPRLQNLLREHEAAARQSKELATIVTDVPVELHLEECLTSRYSRAQVTDFFRELEFFSLLPKLPAGGDGETTVAAAQATGETPVAKDYRVITDSDDFTQLLRRLKAAESFTFDLETTSLDMMTAELVGVSLSLAPGEVCYLPVGHRADDGAAAQLPLADVVAGLKPIFEDEKIRKQAHNGKYDTAVLAGYRIAVRNLAFDTMIAAHLLGEKAIDLKTLAFSRFGIEMTPITELIGTGSKQITMAEVPVAAAADYACADADVTARLAQLLGPELDRQGLRRLFDEVEMPLVPILVKMERNGIAVDTYRLEEMSRRLGDRLAELEREIYDAVGHEFNINSPRQLGAVLFDELGLPGGKKTRSGYATGAAVLEALRPAHPAIDLILEFRQLGKLKSTYIDALPALVNPETGRVHTRFNQTRTATGRLSSSEPNLQNIPVRAELAREIRQAFVAPPGTCLLAGDYSQIDLRVLAHLSQAPQLINAFLSDADIHAATAAQLFGVAPSKVTPEMRRLAKTVNFGVIYGMSDYGLEQATELSRGEAARFIAAYFEKYPGVKGYLEATKQQARDLGYVQTLRGRKRFIPEIKAANRMVCEAAERMAINMPVQGTSADIIKIAMINLDHEMSQLGLKSRLLLQVHDELIFEVPLAEKETMLSLVPQVMSAAVLLAVPLKVDVKTGANWGDME